MACGLLLDWDMRETKDPISRDVLDQVSGGMKWEGRRESYNVEDRRPGAPPQWQQTVTTWWHNFRNGYLW
jgi:hypothetical protein